MISSVIYQWLDLIWVLLALLLTHKQHRLVAVAYMLSCVLMLRMQIEFMESIGHSYGFLGLLKFHSYERGLFVYGLCNIIFLLAAHFSPGAKKVIVLASALSFFFFALFGSMIVMLL